MTKRERPRWQNLYPWEQQIIEDWITRYWVDADRRLCTYCGVLMHDGDPQHWRRRTKDHVVPVSVGGPADLYVYACRICNMKKGNSLDVALAILSEDPELIENTIRAVEKLPVTRRPE